MGTLSLSEDELEVARTLADGVVAGHRRSIARAISLVENEHVLSYEVCRRLYPHTGCAYRVGMTGPPGVGKSSIISSLISVCRGGELSIGVVSVDPSSPFTKGALLGDRIRLADHFLDSEVFIRSMGTRGHLGGIAETTLQASLILDAAGKDIIFLETVGVGQSEIEIAAISDTVVLSLMPGSGDSIQALKAGVMEIPDIFVVNKKDHPAAGQMVHEIKSILALGEDRKEWTPAVLATEAVKGDGIRELWNEVMRHRGFLEERGLLEERRRENLAREVISLAAHHLERRMFEQAESDQRLAGILERVKAREMDPLSAVRVVMADIFGWVEDDE